MYSVKCIVFIYFYKIEIKQQFYLIFVKFHSPTLKEQNHFVNFKILYLWSQNKIHIKVLNDRKAIHRKSRSPEQNERKAVDT